MRDTSGGKNIGIYAALLWTNDLSFTYVNAGAGV
jgi:hypothetical protein